MPDTHYEIFAGLRDARVSYLVTGATALVLHGVPRITPDVDLAVDPNPANIERLERLLAAWGYAETRGEAAAAEGAPVRRFRHPRSALDEIDVVLPPRADAARLRAGSAVVSLVDLEIPIVGAADLISLKTASGTPSDRDDAAGLKLLAAIREGDPGADGETRRTQIRKFSRWSVPARLDWLLASARQRKGMSPEARPMTRNLRSRPWAGRR